jgi:excinuclease ABC subunit A
VLGAGPRVERQRFDPSAAEEPKAGDVELEAVGRDAAMPWQTDGRRWHTQDRVTTEGKPARWQGGILTWLDEQVHALGAFGPTDWGERGVVEVPGPQKSGPWFLHALTGEEWLLRIVFRVARNAFAGPALAQRLGVRPLNESPELGLPVYSPEPRVWVTNHKGPWQSVTVRAHKLSEIDTPAFRAFLKEAATSFAATLKRLQTKPEDVMPWKLNGERWHTSDKGFRPGARVRWERALLPRLLALVKEVEPGVAVTWDSRDHIALRVPGVGRMWAGWKTKEAAGLECRFLGKKGQINLAQVEGLGAQASIDTHRGDGDVLRLVFQELRPEAAPRLKAVLAEQLRGFREAFGG